MTKRNLVATLTASVCMVAMAPSAYAQAQAIRIPAGSLKAVLDAYVRQTGRQLIYKTGEIAGRRSPGVAGTADPDAALVELLKNTGFSFRADSTGAIAIVSGEAEAGGVPADNESADIVVTGSLIRGAPVASPVIKVDQQGIRDSGKATLAEAIKDIPQNFGGGQNPGIGLTVPTASGVDVGGGSSLNLRGLGSDATLTLLNGHRVAYNASRQSIDISSIPLAAVDRIEIVPDGASALYGSDAVGGVANIILKPDLDHLETRARIGGSTDGGNLQQQYAIAGGTRWQSGGFIAAVEYNHGSAIEFSDRDYARSRAAGLRLYPSLNNKSGIVSAHQSLSGSLDLSVDALFNQRHELFLYAYNATGDRSLSSQIQASKDRAYAIEPVLTWSLGTWRTALAGSYARDKVAFGVDVTTGPDKTHIADGTYDNITKSIEISGDGDLLRLPAGAVKLALGAGFRNYFLENNRGASSPLNIRHSRDNDFAYGELSVPLVAPAMDVPGIDRLNLSAAIRREHYNDVGSVSTPKLGLIYAPSSAIDLKASWGRSFRAPTLYQRYSPLLVYAYDPTSFGGSGYPSGATVIYLQGQNTNLRPERATTWSVTADFHPPQIPKLDVAIDYFDVDYVDRIVQPIPYTSQALSNPAYAAQVTAKPSADQIAALIAAGYFTNVTSRAYDPSTVVALVDNRNVNAGRQRARGVDVSASYRFDLANEDVVALAGNLAYLESRRRIGSEQPDTPLAGTLYNPPHWRGRATTNWRHGALAITVAGNYTGVVSDVRSNPAPKIGPVATFDVTARYRLDRDAPSWLRGVDISLSIQDLFDRKPPLIATAAPYETPYDSTNYTPVDRFISFSVAKSW